jgi:type II secretory pathway pseudopilin PulG
MFLDMVLPAMKRPASEAQQALMKKKNPSLKQRPATNQGGFSVVEVLIAAAVLLIVTIGILPLFTRAISSNVQGQQLTEAVHRAKSEMETMIQAGFNGELMTVASGDKLADGSDGKETIQFWSSEKHAWVDEADLDNDELRTFVRTTRVRQFNIQELRNNPLTKDWTPLVGGSAESEIHLKEIEVMVTTAESELSSVFGPSRQLTLRTIKSF